MKKKKEFNYTDMIWNVRITKQIKLTKRNIRLLETYANLTGEKFDDIINHALDSFLFDDIRFKHIIDDIFRQMSDDEYDPETKRMSEVSNKIESDILEKYPEIEEIAKKEVIIE